MIVGKLEDIRKQTAPLPQILQAIDHVQQLDFDTIADSRYQLPGSHCEVIIQTFKPERIPQRLKVEGHIRFIDFYYNIDGSEVIGTMAAKDLVDKTAYDQDLDVWTCEVAREKLSLLKLNQGDAVILFPEDAHAPQWTEVEPAMTRKVIVKIEI